MEFVIDRFEGEFAVVELADGKIAELPKALLPIGAKEGDTVKIFVDEYKTIKREKEIKELMDDVWED